MKTEGHIEVILDKEGKLIGEWNDKGVRMRKHYKLEGIFHIFKIIYYGIKYKYPLCCIYEFINEYEREHINETSSSIEKLRFYYAYCHDGYKPCRKCFKRILLTAKGDE